MNRFEQAVHDCMLPTAELLEPPARVREIHGEQLARLEAERGEGLWVLGNG
jgi:hypothetical protein